MIGYDAFRAEQARGPRARAACSGSGSACTSSRRASPMGSMASEAAIVRIGVNGQVQALMSSGSHGQSLETTIAQVVADELGVDIDDVTVDPGRHRVGAVRRRAPAAAAARCIAAAAPPTRPRRRCATRCSRSPPTHLEAAPEDLEIERRPDLGASARRRKAIVDRRGRRASPTSTRPRCRRAWRRASRRRPAYTPTPPFTWSNSCHACVVEVDPRTGAVDVLRYVVSEDCGVMINPTSSRARSPAAWCRASAACSTSTWSTTTPATRWRRRSSTTCCRPRPRCRSIEYGHIETPATTNPGGYKGMGEGGAIGSPPRGHQRGRRRRSPTSAPASPASRSVAGRRRRRHRGRVSSTRRTDRSGQASATGSDRRCARSARSSAGGPWPPGRR